MNTVPVKRLRDLIIGSLVVAVFWPVALLIALLIKLDSPGPVLYRQTRIGYRGRPFTLYKFRTMVVGADKGQTSSQVIGDFRTYRFHSDRPDPRVTRAGRILRLTTMDEASQFLNVVKGDLSLVGPRPELPDIVAQYPPEYHERHRVKPGLTCLAAVNGRSKLTYRQTVMYDLEYVRNPSLWRDLQILVRTVGVVLSKKGAR